MKTYSYDVDVVYGDYNCSYRVDEVARFDSDGGSWMTFYAAGSETLAVFSSHSVVAVVKDVDSVKDSEAVA